MSNIGDLVIKKIFFYNKNNRKSLQNNPDSNILKTEYTHYIAEILETISSYTEEQKQIFWNETPTQKIIAVKELFGEKINISKDLTLLQSVKKTFGVKTSKELKQIIDEQIRNYPSEDKKINLLKNFSDYLEQKKPNNSSIFAGKKQENKVVIDNIELTPIGKTSDAKKPNSTFTKQPISCHNLFNITKLDKDYRLVRVNDIFKDSIWGKETLRHERSINYKVDKKIYPKCNLEKKDTKNQQVEEKAINVKSGICLEIIEKLTGSDAEKVKKFSLMVEVSKKFGGFSNKIDAKNGKVIKDRQNKPIPLEAKDIMVFKDKYPDIITNENEAENLLKIFQEQSKYFQTECKKLGILSGREGSDKGLRFTFLSEDVIDKINACFAKTDSLNEESLNKESRNEKSITEIITTLKDAREEAKLTNQNKSKNWFSLKR